MSTSPARRSRGKGIIERRNLTAAETLDFNMISNLVTARKFELAQLQGNTALIPDGQAFIKQLEAVVTVLDDVSKLWIAKKLTECGYPNGTKCSLNMTTGEIYLQHEA